MLGIKYGSNTVIICKGFETEDIMREICEADCAGVIDRLSWVTNVKEFVSEKVYVIRWSHQMKRYNRFRFKV